MCVKCVCLWGKSLKYFTFELKKFFFVFCVNMCEQIECKIRKKLLKAFGEDLNAREG